MYFLHNCIVQHTGDIGPMVSSSYRADARAAHYSCSKLDVDAVFGEPLFAGFAGFLDKALRLFELELINSTRLWGFSVVYGFDFTGSDDS